MSKNKAFRPEDGIRANKLLGVLDRLNILLSKDLSVESKEKKKSQKGAAHIVNPTFRAKRLMNLTPAQYRRTHQGLPLEKRISDEHESG